MSAVAVVSAIAVAAIAVVTCTTQTANVSVTQTLPLMQIIVGAMGGFAGACSVFGNTPLDVIKTRMQGLEASKYKNTFDCAKSILVNEGPR